MFCREGRIPRHACWHSSLLDAHRTQDEKVVHCTLFQVIFDLQVKPKLKVLVKSLARNFYDSGLVHTLTKVAHQLSVHPQREKAGVAAVRANTKKKVSYGLGMGAESADVHPMMTRFPVSLQAEHGHSPSNILTADKETLYIMLKVSEHKDTGNHP